jgi:hypothetical protein
LVALHEKIAAAIERRRIRRHSATDDYMLKDMTSPPDIDKAFKQGAFTPRSDHHLRNILISTTRSRKK